MFTHTEKAKAARREVSQRRYVYERRIDAGKMTREKANREIAIMEEIAQDYEQKALDLQAQERLL